MNEQLYKTLYEELKREENYTNKIYMDKTGNLTAGLGHKLTPDEINKYGKEGDTVPEDVLQGWARKDIESSYGNAQSQANELGVENEDFTRALMQVNFQLGTSWNKSTEEGGKFPKAYQALKDGDYEQAIYEIEHNSKGEDSAWKTQTGRRVENFGNAINKLTPYQPEASVNEEQEALQVNRRALSYNYGVVKRNTPEGFNTFMVMKSFGVAFNLEQSTEVNEELSESLKPKEEVA